MIERRQPGPTDVAIEILFCGVCHSDLHTVRGEWSAATYPCVPGHEIIGRVTAVGEEVNGYSTGDTVGVGCMVDSCRSCDACADGLEQFCEKGATFTYNSRDPHLGGVTFGGYSTSITVDQGFVVRVPASLDPAAAAPLLCAGITTYSPLRHWNVGTGSRVGVVGLGGLGHMAVKLAHAMGAEVTLFTSSESKVADGLRLGAHHVVVTSGAGSKSWRMVSADAAADRTSRGADGTPAVRVKHAADPQGTDSGTDAIPAVRAKHAAGSVGRSASSDARPLASPLPGSIRLDLIINTVSAPHNLDAYLERLDRDGVMVMVGVPPTPHPSPSVGKLIGRRRSLAGSLIGGIPETQEMLDFCAEHGIVSDIEMIPMQSIDEAYERMLRSDVKYRFVIDMASLRADAA